MLDGAHKASITRLTTPELIAELKGVSQPMEQLVQRLTSLQAQMDKTGAQFDQLRLYADQVVAELKKRGHLANP